MYAAARPRAGRRGRRAVADLRRHGQRRALRRRHAGVRGRRLGGRAVARPAGRRAPRSARARGRSSTCPTAAIPGSLAALERIADRHGLAAPRRTPRTPSARASASATSARSATPPPSASSRTRTWPIGEGGMVVTGDEALGRARAAAALARDDGAQLGSRSAATRPATTSSRSASTTASTIRARRSVVTGSRAWRTENAALAPSTTEAYRRALPGSVRCALAPAAGRHAGPSPVHDRRRGGRRPRGAAPPAGRGGRADERPLPAGARLLRAFADGPRPELPGVTRGSSRGARPCPTCRCSPT